MIEQLLSSEIYHRDHDHRWSSSAEKASSSFFSFYLVDDRQRQFFRYKGDKWSQAVLHLFVEHVE